MTPCSLVGRHRNIASIFCLEDGDNTFLRNVDNQITRYHNPEDNMNVDRYETVRFPEFEVSIHPNAF
jgi:hypothetical protein